VRGRRVMLNSAFDCALAFAACLRAVVGERLCAKASATARGQRDDVDARWDNPLIEKFHRIAAGRSAIDASFIGAGKRQDDERVSAGIRDA
jgi:hypothetical protein